MNRPAQDHFCPAPAPLQEVVLYLWRRRFAPGAETTRQPVLPDGCIDVVSVNGGAPFVMGPETVRADYLLPGGTDVVGVRLRPGVGARLFGGAMAELVDQSIPACDLPGARGARASAGPFTEVLPEHRPLLEVLLPRVEAAGPDDGVSFGVAWMARHPRATIDQLATRLGWSPREIRRRFTAAIGFGPKVMQRTLRFQLALTLAERRSPGERLSLARLAAASGYADQAHMTREFRQLAQSTPGELLAGLFDPTLFSSSAPGAFRSAAEHVPPHPLRSPAGAPR